MPFNNHILYCVLTAPNSIRKNKSYSVQETAGNLSLRSFFFILKNEDPKYTSQHSPEGVTPSLLQFKHHVRLCFVEKHHKRFSSRIINQEWTLILTGC